MAWDSSLHDSLLLNCVTPTNKKVFVTLTIHLQVSVAFYVWRSTSIMLVHLASLERERETSSFECICIEALYHLLLLRTAGQLLEPGGAHQELVSDHLRSILETRSRLTPPVPPQQDQPAQLQVSSIFRPLDIADEQGF